jgi:hypothetical protein
MRFRERLRKLERKMNMNKRGPWAFVVLLPAKKEGKLFWEVQFMEEETGLFESREEAEKAIDEQFQGGEVFLVTVAEDEEGEI